MQLWKNGVPNAFKTTTETTVESQEESLESGFHSIHFSDTLSLSTFKEGTMTGGKQHHPFSVSYNGDGELVIHSVIPDGIKVGTGTFGKCLVATTFFSAGSSIYRGFAALLDTSANCDVYHLYLYDDDDQHEGKHQPVTPPGQNMNDYYSPPPVQVFRLDGVNSVKDCAQSNNDSRQVYGFDGFMNHSCNPNVYCPSIKNDDCQDISESLMCYDAIALRDIKPGDEITCDYAVFDYSCDGHGIEECGCKAPNCRGQMKGFQGLTLQEKVRIMHICDPTIVDTFFRMNPDVVCVESTIPSNKIRLVSESDEVHIVSAKTFLPGDLIFTNHSTIISSKDFEEHQAFILKLYEESNGNDDENKHTNKIQYELLDKNRHIISRPTYVECLGFDSFMDHSCNPNSEQYYESAVTYSVYATRKIHEGEKITCDYLKLDNVAKNQENIVTTSFLCRCGEKNCRIQISC